MKHYALILLLAGTANAHHFNLPFDSNLHLSGHVTQSSWWTTGNNFNDHDSKDGAHDFDAGIRFALVADWSPISIKTYHTIDHPLDYAFAEYLIGTGNYGDYGIRAGRIARLSGLFSGFGPAQDRMNFLPQSTAPNRYGRTFFRYDGIQLFSYHSFGQTDISTEISYGKGVVADSGGILETSDYLLLLPNETDIGQNQRPLMINLNLYLGGNHQLFLDYVYTKLSLDSVADISAFGQRLQLPVTVNEIVGHVYKIGYGQIWGVYEWLASAWITDIQLSDQFGVAGFEFGDAFLTQGYDLVVRYPTGSNWQNQVYGGLTFYRGEQLKDAHPFSVIQPVPDHTHKGQSLFAGYSHQFGARIIAIGEVHYNQGGAYISATHQHPATTQGDWWLFSGSLSVLF